MAERTPYWLRCRCCVYPDERGRVERLIVSTDTRWTVNTNSGRDTPTRGMTE